MCGKRSSVVQRLKIRKAKLLKLLNGEQIGWNTSVKLHAELDHVKKLLIKKKSEKKARTLPPTLQYQIPILKLKSNLLRKTTPRH